MATDVPSRKLLASAVIDFKARTIILHDADGEPITLPLTHHGTNIVKYTSVSAGGHLLQALRTMLQDKIDRGGL